MLKSSGLLIALLLSGCAEINAVKPVEATEANASIYRIKGRVIDAGYLSEIDFQKEDGTVVTFTVSRGPSFCAGDEVLLSYKRWRDWNQFFEENRILFISATFTKTAPRHTFRGHQLCE